MGATDRARGRAGQPKILMGITYEEDGVYYAVCLNHFLLTVASRKEELEAAIQRMIRTYVDACRRHQRVPFENLGPAPDEYWTKWFNGSPELRKDPSEETKVKPLSFHPLSFEEAVSGLLGVKPKDSADKTKGERSEPQERPPEGSED